MGLTTKEKKRPILDRFLDKVDKKGFNHCWEWTASRTVRSGYGRWYFRGKLVAAHRVSWTLYKGEIPKNINVCHKCDNPPCVNPNHLFLGTQKENIYDMHRKKRGEKLRKMTHASDETHQVSKLTNNEVKFIRSCGLKTSEIAKILKFKVQLLAIRRVLHRETYRDVL